MEKQTLTEEQCRLVEKYYYLVGQVMNDLKLSENDVEDWHGFFSVVLCEYIMNLGDEYAISKQTVEFMLRDAFAAKIQEEPISLSTEPVGLIKGGDSYK